jgi:hypothetical protein
MLRLPDEQMEAARKEAAYNHKNPSLEKTLAKWWSKKYSLPSNHELFLSRTVHDLLVELLEDRFEDSPIESHRGADGEIIFTETGDPLIDSWEQKIAAGEQVDLWESFSSEDAARVKRLLDRKAGVSTPRPFKDVVDDQERRMRRLVAKQHPKHPNIPLTFGED